MSAPTQEQLDSVVIRFAGDSGDGMQLAGTQFTLSSAIAGNDLATLPDFPAEIRAPAGTTYGVSGFQVHFGAHELLTPGDRPDVLVTMNPAALKANLGDLDEGNVIIADSDSFTDRNLKLVDYEENPLEDGSLSNYRLHAVPMTSMTIKAVESTGLKKKAARRCTNFFALGLTYWMYSRSLEPTLKFLKEKFGKKPEILEANTLALKAGYNFGETAETFIYRYEVPPADIPPGEYRAINGNQALSYGLVAGAKKAGLDLFFAGYPITPASSILEELAALKHMGVRTVQAEDEIASIGVALGASYAGSLGVTASSGPGIALKGEFIGLTQCVELPMVIVNIQRGGPSTGLPTKTEQSDLHISLYGRHGDTPMPVVAASSPGDAFHAAMKAAFIAVKYMTPVMLLSDGSIANGSEPWLMPKAEDLPDLEMPDLSGITKENFKPYGRDVGTLARPWVTPGMKDLEHRVGGLEKEHETGDISYDPDNHALMTKLRAEKVAAIANEYEPIAVDGPSSGKLLMLSWGSTYGAVSTAVIKARKEGLDVSHVHLRYINPLPNDLGEVLSRFEKVIVPEINTGQLVNIIRAKYLVDAKGYNRVRGLPFSSNEILVEIKQELGA